MPTFRALDRRPLTAMLQSVVLVGLLLAGLGPGTAVAHDEEDAVRYTVPPDGSEIQEAPATVLIEFAFDLAPDVALRVVDEAGIDYVRSLRIEEERRLVAEVDPLGQPGIYSATYDVGYAQQSDHHRQGGSFSFIYAPDGSDPFADDDTIEDPADPAPAPPPPGSQGQPTDGPGADGTDSDEQGPRADNPRPGDLADGFVAAASRGEPVAADDGSWWSELDPPQRVALALVVGVVLLVVGAVERWTRPSR